MAESIAWKAAGRRWGEGRRAAPRQIRRRQLRRRLALAGGEPLVQVARVVDDGPAQLDECPGEDPSATETKMFQEVDGVVVFRLLGWASAVQSVIPLAHVRASPCARLAVAKATGGERCRGDPIRGACRCWSSVMGDHGE